MGNGRSKTDTEQLGGIRNHFTKEEIDDWYQEFRKHCKTKKGQEFLTEKDFVKVYNTVFPGDSSSYARHIFRTFDIDGNGEVNFREFLIGLSVSGSEDIEKNLRWAFDVYDVSRNGSISKEEMEEIVKSVYKMLDLTTVPKEYGTPARVADKMFQKMDKDKDGNLTFEEFREGVMMDPFLLNLLQCSPPSGDAT